MIEKTERRGRPVEQPTTQLEKWTREYYEVPTKPELGYKMIWHYDINKNSRIISNKFLIINITLLFFKRFFDDFICFFYILFYIYFYRII